MVTAFLGIGANLGNRAETLKGAVRVLDETPGIRVIGASPLYETPPAGVTDQPHFLNAVLRVETALPARALLDLLLDTERQFGRVRLKKWGPRTLDLDILLYGDQVIDEEGLRVPHPYLPERAFVLQPLCDLFAEGIHPVLGQTFCTLLKQVSGRELLRRLSAPVLME